MKKTMKKLTKPKQPQQVKAAPPLKRLVKKAVPVPVSVPTALKKPEPPAPRSGPEPVVPAKHKWVGKKDPKFKGMLLVKPGDMPATFPKASDKCVPDTYWRVDPKTDITESLVTILPDGVHVAWWACAVCNNHARRCICKTGIINSRGVEWIFIRALMKNDPALNTKTSEPIIDCTHFDVTSRAVHWYKGRETGRVAAPRAAVTPVRTSTGTQAPPKPVRPAERPAAGVKPLHKPVSRSGLRKVAPATPAKDQVDVSNLNLSQLNKDAASAADALSDQVLKSLSKSGTKPLKKRK